VARMLWRFKKLFKHTSNALFKKTALIACYLVSVTLAYQLFQYFYNPTTFYNSVGYIDPYVSVGYGLYYSIPDFLDWYYKVSRLPWNILEFTARHILRPEGAAFFLQFFSASLMSISVFLYFRRLISKSNALLLAVVSIFFPLFYGDGRPDYHNTISGPLYFFMLAMLTSSIAERSLLLAAWAGVAAALALHTNPLIALLGPGLALHCFAYGRSHKRTAVFMFRALGISLVGFAAATIGLGAISAAFGRRFLFFMPQLDFMLWLQRNDPWWKQPSWDWWWDWFVTSKPNVYLIGIFAVCLVELVTLGARRRIRDEEVAASAYGGYVVTYLLAVAYHFKGQPVLVPVFNARMFVVATFVPLGYFMEQYLPPLSKRSLAILSAIFPLACAIALFDSKSIYQNLGLSLLVPITLVTLTLAGIYLALRLFSTTRINLAVVLLPSLIIALIPDVSTYAYDSCRATSHLNVFISNASTFATEIAGHPNRVYVIADPTEHMTGPCFEQFDVYALALSLTSVGHDFLGDKFQQHQLDQLTRDNFASLLEHNGMVALLAVNGMTKDHFVETAAKLGVDLQLVGLFPDSISGVKLYLFRIGAR
jgi:Dolichyl-phosphate-mannose-protein mannosyltransferase